MILNEGSMKLLFVMLLSGGLSLQWAQTESRPNMLSPGEQKEGFILLFDGKSLDKWDTGVDQKVWTIVGRRHQEQCQARRWKNPDQGRVRQLRPQGGISRRPGDSCSHSAATAPTRRGGRGGAGYELQIRDKDPSPRPDGSFLTASLVNVGRAPADAKILAGRWNSVEITMDGAHMMVTYNGRKVVDGQDSRRASGCVALDLATPNEAPDANIEFRNLKIKRLP